MTRGRFLSVAIASFTGAIGALLNGGREKQYVITACRYETWLWFGLTQTTLGNGRTWKQIVDMCGHLSGVMPDTMIHIEILEQP